MFFQGKEPNKPVLGRVYADGEVIFQQGESAACLYVVLDGQVDVVVQDGEEEVRLETLKQNDVFGEMSLIERSSRSATVRARGEARVITLDQKGFLQRFHEDPALAVRVMKQMCGRVRVLNGELVRLRQLLRQAGIDPDPKEGGDKVIQEWTEE